MAGTVDERKLKVLLFNIFIEPCRNTCEERRKAEIQSNASFLRLRIFVKAGSGCDGTENPANGSLAGIHMSKHANIDIQALVGLDS